MRKMVKWMLTNCSVNDNPGKEDIAQKADFVVYGKIFTAEGNQVVEAAIY